MISPGPCEKLYAERYDSFVTSVLHHYNSNEELERKRREFSSLSNERREEKMKAVNSLLARLGISYDLRDAEEREGDRGCRPDGMMITNEDDSSHTTFNDTTIGNTTISTTGVGSATRLDVSEDFGVGGEGCVIPVEMEEEDYERFDYGDSSLNGPRCRGIVDEMDRSYSLLSPHNCDGNDANKVIDHKSRVIPTKGGSEDETESSQSRFSLAEKADETSHQDNSCSSVEIGRGAACFGKGRRGIKSPSLLLSPNETDQRSRAIGDVNKKRLASCSGKKGMDSHRLRRDATPLEFQLDGCDRHERIFDANASQSPLLMDVDARHDDNGGIISSMLLASQSPIENYDSSDVSIDDDKHHHRRDRDRRKGDCDAIESEDENGSDNSSALPRRAIQFGEFENTQRGTGMRRTQPSSELVCDGNYHDVTNDTIESRTCPVLPNGEKAKVTTVPECEVPACFRLKDGVCFRMHPLKMRSRLRQQQRVTGEKTRADGVDSSSAVPLSFPDPLASFPIRTAEHLGRIVTWLQRKDSQISSTAAATNKEKTPHRNTSDVVDSSKRGVVLSLSHKQIQAVVIRLLKSRGARSSRDKMSNAVGGTLMIFREKDDVERWERFFRERSSFSVVNHAGMPSTARKRASVSRCSGFDIVLTTFDAIKAKEHTLPIDEMGHSITEKIMGDDGWYLARSGGIRQDAQACVQMSVLHRITWWKVVFVDGLGRGSYITKAATARASAGRALIAKSRYIFFAQSDNSTGMLEKKIKEDHKQLCAIAGMLHIPEDRAAETVVGEAMIDMEEIISGANFGNEIDMDTSYHTHGEVDMSPMRRAGYESSSDSEDIPSPI